MPDNFVGQTDLIIKLDTKRELTDVTDQRIVYRKPDGTRGFWPAAVDGTTIFYAVQAGDIDQAGEWQFQAQFKTGNGVAIGGVYAHEFLNPVQEPSL